MGRSTREESLPAAPATPRTTPSRWSGTGPILLLESTTGRSRTPGEVTGARTASSGCSEVWVCVGSARRWLWRNVKLWPEPRMQQSPLRRLVTMCTATAPVLLKTPATNRQSAPAVPRAVDSAQEPPQWPPTPATTCTATAPTSAAGSLMTSAGRRAANAEENPLEHFDQTTRELQKNKIPNDLVFNLNKI